MSRPAGLPKTGGRKKGIPNKKTQELEVILEKLGANIPSQIVEALPHLRLEKRVDTLMGLMTFLYRKRKAIEKSAENEDSCPSCSRIKNMTEEELEAEHARLQAILNDPGA